MMAFTSKQQIVHVLCEIRDELGKIRKVLEENLGPQE